MTDQNLGRILANRYELIKFIDQGAMGSVYLARDRLLGGVSVAVKLLSQHILDDLTIDQFKTEAKISALLGHKCTNVVRVIDHKLTRDGQPFYVMEYLEGQNIRQIVRVQPLGIPRFLELARQTCLALKAAHAGILFDNQVVPIIHRDIKPSNILVLRASSGELVKVLDFGIAKLLETNTSTDDPRFRGTIAYASPEQMDGQELDCRSDIYSLGITMYEMLTGRLPYRPQRNSFGGWHKVHLTHEPKPLKSVIPLGTSPQLLNGVCDLVMSCLEKTPQQRPVSVDEILTGLMTLQREMRPARAVPAGVRLKPKPAPKPVQTPAPKPATDLDWILRSQTWPAEVSTNQETSLPKLLLRDKQQQLPMLWIMLSPEEIRQRLQNRRYNTFLCTMHPYPMILWVSAFHSDRYGYRWFDVYLHPKKNRDRNLLWHLSDVGSYPTLLFSQRPPHAVAEIYTFNIAQAQCKLLKEWILRAQATPSIGTPKDSQTMLKREFEKLKHRGFK